MCAIAFDLLFRGDGAEDDLGKLARVEGTICYATDGILVSTGRYAL